MTNAEKFQKVFGYYATEMWAKPEKEFLEWVIAEALEHEQNCVKCKHYFHCCNVDEEYEHDCFEPESQEHEQNCVKCKHYYETEDADGVHSNCKQEKLICKHCVHCAVKGEFAKYRYCDMWNSVVNENGYCNYGEKHEQV